jgi:hypothetical protein
MRKPSVNFEQTVQTLSKQTCIYPSKFAQCELFLAISEQCELFLAISEQLSIVIGGQKS